MCCTPDETVNRQPSDLLRPLGNASNKNSNNRTPGGKKRNPLDFHTNSKAMQSTLVSLEQEIHYLSIKL